MVLLLTSCGNSNKQQEVKEKIEEQVTADNNEYDSHIVEKMKYLYDELQGFKCDNEFIKIGFAPAGPYKDWYDRVIKLREEEPKDFVIKSGLSAADLLNLGLEYVNSKGIDNDKTGYYTRRFEVMFNPKNLDDGKSIDNVDIAKGKVLGKWLVKNKFAPNDEGFTIEIINVEESYFSIEAGEKKKLNKLEDKYYVVGDVDNTYYMINNGNLRFYGVDGDYTDQAGWVISTIK